MHKQLIIGALLLLLGPAATAQNNQEAAVAKGRQAIELVDEGKLEEGIKLLKEAQALDPKNSSFPYEIGYAYYEGKNYQEARGYLEKALKYKDAYDRFYQLLGNCYDNLGNSAKAVKTYEAGLKKFPHSGNLYLEMGVMQLGKKDYDKALEYYEKGIEVAPEFPSNYYWASKIYCASSEEVWGMIYGELFMNLERNSRRTAEISKLLYDTYKSEIKFPSDTSASVSFSRGAVINVTPKDLKHLDVSKLKLPYGGLVYEPALLLALGDERSIDLGTLARIRQRFVENYFANPKNKNYPNVLFDYQRDVQQAGHLEAYSYWLLMKGDETAFTAWQNNNQDKWAGFVQWFKVNPIQLNEAHRFHRLQY